MDQIKNSNFTFKNYLALYYNNYKKKNTIAGKVYYNPKKYYRD